MISPAVSLANYRDQRHYLRLTPLGWQSIGEVQGEPSFIETIRRAGIATPAPVPAQRGVFIERVPDRRREFLAVVFEAAPGRFLDAAEWDEPRGRRRGRRGPSPVWSAAVARDVVCFSEVRHSTWMCSTGGRRSGHVLHAGYG